MSDFKRGLGQKPDTPDRRDRLLYQAVPNIDALPASADVEKLLPTVMDQLNTGSCVGYSGASVLYAVQKKDGHRRPFIPSPVFIYREARVLGGYVEEDAGCEIRNAWKAANKLGITPMSILKPRFEPRDIADPHTYLFPETSIWRKEPSPSIYKYAQTRQAIQYFSMPSLGDFLKCLADGWPAQVGFSVHASMYDPRTGTPFFNVPEPRFGEQPIGGHAVTAYGYDKPSRRVFFRNSWGPTAHEGKPNFTLSFEFVEQHVSSAWTGRLIEGGKLSAIVPAA